VKKTYPCILVTKISKHIALAVIGVPSILHWRGFTWWGTRPVPSPSGVQGQSPGRGSGPR